MDLNNLSSKIEEIKVFIDKGIFSEEKVEEALKSTDEVLAYELPDERKSFVCFLRMYLFELLDRKEEARCALKTSIEINPIHYNNFIEKNFPKLNK